VSLPQTRLTGRVLVVSVDGLRPDAIGARETPTLFCMMQTGSYSLTATTILPSKTLPSHNLRRRVDERARSPRGHGCGSGGRPSARCR
jgi:hypothetical protein